MGVLGITTSSLEGSVSIALGEEIFTKTFQSSLMSHSSLLLPSVKEVMRISNCSFKDLEYIAVDVGPGSFTGIRLAIACAEALTITSKVKPIAVSSIDILAKKIILNKKIEDGKPGRFVVVIDAGRQELYGARFIYSQKAGLQKLTDDSLFPEEEIERLSDSYELCGYLHKRNTTFKSKSKLQVVHPDSESLVKLALERSKNGNNLLKPNYIRSPHVIIKKR